MSQKKSIKSTPFDSPRSLFNSSTSSEFSKAKDLLVIDIGGHNVKVYCSEVNDVKKIPSGKDFTPKKLIEAVQRDVLNKKYSKIAIGFPGPVKENKPIEEPKHLGLGWKNYDFTAAFGLPCKVINDAALQALGSYWGGAMLFLGLGTGLGSALIIKGTLQPLELQACPYRKGKTVEDYVSTEGLKELGHRKWNRHVLQVIELFRYMLQVDYVVVGGGNSKFLNDLPSNTFLGSNQFAFLGGIRLWEGIPKEFCSNMFFSS